MKKLGSKKIIKIVIVFLIVFNLMIVLPLTIWIEYDLVTNSPETSAGDIISVVKVNFGSDHEVIKTETNKGAVPEFSELEDVKQTIMTKNYHEFIEYISKKGCRVIDQGGDLYFMAAPDGKKFAVFPVHRMKAGIYCTVGIAGITIEEISSLS